MRRLTTPLHVRTLLLRCFSSSTATAAATTTTTLRPQLSFLSPPPPSPPHRHHPFSLSASTYFLSLPFSDSSSAFRCFSSQSDPIENNPQNEEQAIASSLSEELLKDPDADSLPLTQRLDLSFSHITITPSLLLTTLNISPDAGRTIVDFLKWAKSRSNFELNYEVFSYFVDYLRRRKDFKATHDLLLDGKGIAGPKTMESAIDRVVRAGRPMQVVAFFEKI